MQNTLPIHSGYITGTLTIESFPGDGTVVSKVYHLKDSDGVSNPNLGYLVANTREPDEITIKNIEYGEDDE